MPRPQLGITTDESFQVVDVRANSAANAAGVKIGDLLLDLTWISSDAPMWVSQHADILYVNSAGLVVDSAGNSIVDATGRRLTPADIRTLDPDPYPAVPIDPPSGAAMFIVPPKSTPAPVLPPISVLVLPGGFTPARPTPPPVADYIEKETVPFTADNVPRLIHSMIAYGVPLRLKLQRGDREMEVTITPTTPWQLFEESGGTIPIASPTPLLSGHSYF